MHPKACDSFARIVSERHAERLAGLLEDAHGGQVMCGGKYNTKERYVDPTILWNPSVQSRVMQEEIFGPILPVVTMGSISEIVAHINKRPSPLALYVFSSSAETCDAVINSTRSGGACANDVIVHMLNENLPFGGCGDSGMGNYHGVYGFRTFSHEKAVIRVDAASDSPARYPPYS